MKNELALSVCELALVLGQSSCSACLVTMKKKWRVWWLEVGKYL